MATTLEQQRFIKDFIEWVKGSNGMTTVVNHRGNAFGILNINGVYGFEVERFENGMMDIRVYKNDKSHYIHTDVKGFYYKLLDKDDVFEWLIREYEIRAEREETTKRIRKNELENKFGYLKKVGE